MGVTSRRIAGYQLPNFLQRNNFGGMAKVLGTNMTWRLTA